jgi:hypothetical protein
MFGYRIEENFDFAKEQRRTRLMWVMGTGLCLLIVCYFIHPFSMAIFQGYFLTSLSYGDSFYVQRKDRLHEPRLWKAILATLPLHVTFLIAIAVLDKSLPSFFPKIIVWIPILSVAFGIEDLLFDGIVRRFSPSDPTQILDVKPIY